MAATHPISAAKTVGVRELRQNLSRYLERVKDGETLTVTERGHEVARLVPSRPDVDPYYLEAGGEVRRNDPKGQSGRDHREPATASQTLHPPELQTHCSPRVAGSASDDGEFRLR